MKKCTIKKNILMISLATIISFTIAVVLFGCPVFDGKFNMPAVNENQQVAQGSQ